MAIKFITFCNCVEKAQQWVLFKPCQPERPKVNNFLQFGYFGKHGIVVWSWSEIQPNYLS